MCKKKTRDKLLVVDHCHKTKKVRGLLCRKCNTMLHVFDNYKLYKKAVAYLGQ